LRFLRYRLLEGRLLKISTSSGPILWKFTTPADARYNRAGRIQYILSKS
jgi:hypothetical protein